jgi:dATP pyrophosphohydrolase
MTPRIRSDIIDAYVFRRVPGAEPARGGHPSRGSPAIEVLQLRRTSAPAAATWQPVMGHIEPGERATDTLFRELREELGLAASAPDLIDAWALEQVHPFYIAEMDAIFLAPRFAIEVAPHFEPVINEEHDDFRWLPIEAAVREALWPGQRAALRELTRMLGGDPAAELLRLDKAGPDTR